jgi:anaerobic dimethyl sulfoxide reductase subunit B (iron-sulfur subunit)
LPQMGFYINQAICIGCKACTVSCKDKNDLDVGINYRRVYAYEEGQYRRIGESIVPDIKAYTFSIACNHCESPACLKSCPTGAIEKRPEDGVVIIKQDVCIGTKYCISACPYGAPQYNTKLNKSNKCNLCIDLLEKGEDPVCVASCPMGAIEFGPIDELRKKYGKVNQIKGMPSPDITNPNIVITPHRDAKL